MPSCVRPDPLFSGSQITIKIDRRTTNGRMHGGQQRLGTSYKPSGRFCLCLAWGFALGFVILALLAKR